MSFRSVRARITVGVALVAATAFALIAVLAPGIVADVLESDVIDTEAEAAYETLTFSTAFSLDADGLLFDGDELFFDAVDRSFQIIEPDGSITEIFASDIDRQVDILDGFDPAFGDLLEDVLRDFTLDLDVANDVAESQIDQLERTNQLERLINTAAGPFALQVDAGAYAIVEPDGRFEVVTTDFVDLDVPIFTQVNFNELLFFDLGFIETDGRLIDTGNNERILRAVPEIDDVELLVTANAASIDRSVSRIRTSLWLAAPLLTAAVAAIGWLLTGRSLRPVRSITDQAATISGGSLDARVPVPDSRDEIATLAVTVNEMLGRLEHDDRTRRQFISDASHELRSPVAVMRNEAEVALHHPERADVGELATAVADESRRMSTIIDDLLALARHDEKVASPTAEVDLDDIVLAEATRSRRVPVETRHVSAGRIRGRHDEMARMIGHLLDNAARHATSKVAVSLTTTDRHVQLRVDDDGPGVDRDQRTRIFERFARLDEARTRDHGGAGLGLAVVQSIAQRSGGSVDVSDSDLGGARFTVTFPG